jgi:hypothetical protein
LRRKADWPKAKHPDIKHHASNQLKIVFVPVIGGILSAIQTSAHWLLESNFLAGFLNPTSGVSKLIDSYINGLLAISSFRHHRSVGAGSGRDLLEDGRQDDA